MGNIKFIFPEDCYPVRLEVLRKGFSIETTKFPSDYSPGSFHLGYFIDDKLVGIVSCGENNFEYQEEKEAYQLRGMAILGEYQGKSIGMKLCERVEEIAKVFQKEILWCNARVSAVGFYEKLGYQKKGEEFSLPYAGSHYVMYKELIK